MQKKSAFIHAVCSCLLILPFGLLLLGCEAYDPDPFDFRLPKVSSNGLDVAGAYINGEAWININEQTCLFDQCSGLFVVRDTSAGTLTLFMAENDRKSIVIAFSIPDRYGPDLVGLGSQTIVLDGITSTGKLYATDELIEMEEGNEPVPLASNGVGNLVLSASRKNPEAFVLAGTFGFIAESPNAPNQFEVFKGRFDFLMRDENIMVW